MKIFLCLLVCLPAAGDALAEADHARVLESIVPWLAGNPSCWSAVEIRNLGDREVAADIEAHKSSGALAPFVGRSGIQVRLGAGERATYKLQLQEETTGGWVRVREKIPAPQLSPVLAVSGFTECLSGNELHTTFRDVAWPMRNPWFSDEVAEHDNGILALLNTSELPAQVRGCYYSGVFYSIPVGDRPAPALSPVCSATIQELVPPFGSRQYPVAQGGNTRFSLTAKGDAIVLQMLRPTGTNVNVFQVDSTITFGKEAPGR